MRGARKHNGACRTGAALAAWRGAILALAGGIAWGCASPTAGVGLATSSASLAPGSPDEANTAATSIDAFGFDLYGKVTPAEGNLVFSPASIAIALAMADAGARGETATQMDKVLHIGSGAAGGAGVGSLDQALAALSGKFRDAYGNERDVQLRIANAPFAQSGLRIEQAYLDTLASRYGAGLHLVDYRSDAAGAYKTINDWASDQTEKRIPSLLDQPDPTTRLVLVNAIYLKAAWQSPFEAGATSTAGFTRLDGTKVPVQMMSDSSERPYAAGTGWQAVELPYLGGSLAMTIIVPDDFLAFEKGLDAGTFAAITGALRPATVDLSLPRFKSETRMKELKDVLAAMGMPLAMDSGRADFSGITSDERLFISRVVHQANISVDEKGTEATAATAVVMAIATAPPATATVRVDRPFLFALRDTKSGAILFLGRIVDPSAG